MASSSDFFEIFATEPNAATGVTFARYMELAMYHPTAGYYTRDFKRVGRDEKADFFTATSFSPVFGELVVAAAAKLLAPANPADYTFVEVAAEPGAGILRDVAKHPFAAYQTISYGQPFVFPEKSVVFSNELFDAQPFSRVVWREGRWRELGVPGDHFGQGRLQRREPRRPIRSGCGRGRGGRGRGSQFRRRAESTMTLPCAT